MAVRFAGFPSATIFKFSTGKEAAGQCLWGDFVRITGAEENGRLPVVSRKQGWMDPADLQDERILEVVFVDLGQGDGTLMVTPDDQAMIVDAGEGDNMFRFLRWRYNKFRQPFRFPVVVISHGDQDHWGGFGPIFGARNLNFGTVYHNGLVERGDARGSEALGPRVADGRRKFVTGLVRNDAEMRALLSDPAKVRGRRYAGLLKSLIESQRVGKFEMLGRVAGGGPTHVPGFGPERELSIEVLGPVVETAGGGPALRWLGGVGETKNGHSVVLKVRYRSVTLLLGGDLNTPSENLLLSTHTGLAAPPRDDAASEALIGQARRAFEVDFAKACHHGSADFSEVFLRAVNPLATFVSSGDEEAHAHPRPDALGAYGRCGRPPRPLIFSTELFRSTAERIKYPNRYKRELLSLVDEIVEATVSGVPERIERARQKLDDHLVDVDRSVALYGAINLRTDGRRAIVAYRIEQPVDLSRKWDIYLFEPGPNGALTLKAKS
jgi:beta-lactamase superfamily II metal-dependent hydrolase